MQAKRPLETEMPTCYHTTAKYLTQKETKKGSEQSICSGWFLSVLPVQQVRHVGGHAHLQTGGYPSQGHGGFLPETVAQPGAVNHCKYFVLTPFWSELAGLFANTLWRSASC